MKEKEPKIKGNVFDIKILRRLFSFTQPYLLQFYFLLFLTIVAALLGPVRPYLISQAINNYVVTANFDGLQKMVILLLGILIVNGFVQYLQTYLAGWLGQHIIKDIRSRLYSHLLKFRLQFFDKTPIGRLVTRNVSDIETLSDFNDVFASTIGDFLQIFFILGFMFWMDWKLTLFSLSMIPFLLISTYVFKEKIKVSFNEVRTAVANLNTFVQEHITGMNIVQIFNSEEREFKKFQAINEEHKRANLKSVLYYSVYMPIADVIAAVGTGLLLWFGAREAFGRPAEMEQIGGVLIAFIMYIAMFFRPIRMIADRFNNLQMAIVSSERIFKLLDDKEPLQDSGIAQPDTFKGSVKFDHVWFAYNDEEYVLKDISFDVKPGQTVAFVGATGAGKSSVINLLSRFYEINKGEISVDGIDIKHYDVNSLRAHISVVMQDVFLFSDTIYNNITLFNKNISREKVIEAAEMVGARKFIERLPGGFDYNVMERGATLSVGQRQLISFVRSMVYDPKIIVLDEATSSIDTETEELVQGAMEKLMKGRTALVIAHRLSTIQKADKIIVLDKGRIEETGTHEELLLQRGLYYQLNAMQHKIFA